MTRIAILPALFLAAASAQNEPVVVTVEGRTYTRTQLEEMVRALPPAVFQNFSSNKKGFLETLGLMTKLAKEAEAEGLDKRNPHLARLDYNRMQYLATALLNEKDNSLQVVTDEQKKYYEAHKDEYRRAITKVLYVAFNDKPMASADPNAKKPLTQVQAKEKVSALLKQARGGADFIKIIKENSDDAESKGKDGDFVPIRQADQAIPANLRTAVFALKPGEYTDLIQQPNGFYVFRLERFESPDFDAVKDEIYRKMKKELLDQWVNSVRKSVSVQFNDEKYLTEPVAK